MLRDGQMSDIDCDAGIYAKGVFDGVTEELKEQGIDIPEGMGLIIIPFLKQVLVNQLCGDAHLENKVDGLDKGELTQVIRIEINQDLIKLWKTVNQMQDSVIKLNDFMIGEMKKDGSCLLDTERDNPIDRLSNELVELSSRVKKLEANQGQALKFPLIDSSIKN